MPNFVLPCVSGIAVNRYGEKHILMLSLGAAVIGQLIFGAALQARSRSMLVFGRVMIGIGSEVPGVIVSDIVTRWFRYVFRIWIENMCLGTENNTVSIRFHWR